MAQNIRWLGNTYSNVPAITLPKSTSGVAQFDDTTDATGVAADLRRNETMYANNVKVVGTLDIVTYYTGSSAPPQSLGNDGDIYLQT